MEEERGKRGEAEGLWGKGIFGKVESGGGKTPKKDEIFLVGRKSLKTLAQFGAMWYNR